MKFHAIILRVALLILLTTAVIFTLSDTANTSEPYSIHVSSHKLHSDAEKSVRQLKAKGYDAFHQKVNIPGKGEWYRIYIGRWENRKKALSFAKRLKAAGITDYTTVCKFEENKRTISSSQERAISKRVTNQVVGRRLALVIGNATYKTSPLRNPVNDAHDIARTLNQLVTFKRLYMLTI